MKPPLEKVEQDAVRGLLHAAGFWTGSTSQYRRSGQVVGLPDLILLHEGIGVGGWWETKKYQARGWHPFRRETWIPEPLRPEQAAFRDRALRCGDLFGWGGRKEAEAFLVALGLAKRTGNGSILLTGSHRKETRAP